MILGAGLAIAYYDNCGCLGVDIPYFGCFLLVCGVCDICFVLFAVAGCLLLARVLLFWVCLRVWFVLIFGRLFSLLGTAYCGFLC